MALPEKTPERFDAVVIGSGFGGGVAAARLAQAGLRVAVLERGRRWLPGDFPRDDSSLDKDWLWAKDHGLYDVRWLDRMIGVQAAGWGGGSLVYANVFARPPREVFDSWPGGLDRDTLDPYYDLVAHMLRVRPVGADPLTGRVPARTTAMEAVAAGAHRPVGTLRPLLAVTFADDDDADADAATATPTATTAASGPTGAVTTPAPPLTRGTCTFVGECMFGCNEGAKNSVDRTYLAVAEAHGATAFPRCEVDVIEPIHGGGYRVHYLDHATGERAVVVARTVFMAAGAVATTELLLRNRDHHRTLPHLSPALGRGFSGNGDVLAFVSRPRTALEPGRGPTITTTTVVDCHVGGTPVWFQVQDGAYPEQLAGLVRSLNPLGRRRPRTTARRRKETMALLMMGRDSSDGVLSLDHQGEAHVDWHGERNAPLYRAQLRAARQVARRLGGRVRSLPAWSLARMGVTVHSLGGVPIGPDAATGVIDVDGRVHGYPGLYVVDGAGIPASTGVNPSATIAAVAERRVETAVRELTGDPGWTAPERPVVRPAPVPEDAAMRAVQQWRRVHGNAYDPSPRAVRFRETMTGSVAVTRSGTSAPVPLRLDLAVELPDVSTPPGRPAPAATVTGTGVVGAAAVRVTGTLELFPDVAGTYMRYHLRYTDGRTVRGELAGSKTHSGGRVPRLSDLTTLRVALDDVGDGVPARGTGTVRISTPRTAALLGSLRATGTRRGAVAAVARFAWYFAATAWLRPRATARVRPVLRAAAPRTTSEPAG